MNRVRRIIVSLVASAALLLVALSLQHPSPAPATREAVRTNAIRRVPLIATPPTVAAGDPARVTTSAGALAGVARVCATCVSCEITGSSDQVCTDTAQDGGYSFSGLGASGYRITAAANGFAIGVANAGRAVYLQPGSARGDLDIVLDHEGEEVSGTVTHALGGPVPDANVRVVHWGAQAIATDVHAGADGLFRAYTSAGRITLTATAPGYASARVYRFAPSSNIAIGSTPGASISGTVVTVGDGRPVSGVIVSAAAREASAAAALQTVSGADGSFEIKASSLRATPSARAVRV